MANESTVDQQQLQSTIDELYRKLSELFPAQRDALRNALNTIQVGENQTLGMLAAADDLATAPIGDQAVLMEAIGLGVLSGALNAVDLAAFRTAIGLGTLATLSSLSEADVGDAGVLRQKAGLGSLASLDTLSEADVGDAEVLRQKAGLGNAATRNVGEGEGNVLSRGSFGLGSVGMPSVSSLQDYRGSGFYAYSGGDTPGAGPSGYGGAFLHLQRGSAADSSLTWTNLIFTDSNQIYCQNRGSQIGFSPVFNLLTSLNTTIDANGFIKSASPIFRLTHHADVAVSEGFTASGAGTYNSEAAGVSAKHVDTGVYVVSGSNGLAKDGWTINLPQDVNGNMLCAVKTEQSDDGMLTVRVFKRKFDFESAMIVPGEPMDIPDRWIDLRLSMPKTDMESDKN